MEYSLLTFQKLVQIVKTIKAFNNLKCRKRTLALSCDNKNYLHYQDE